MLVLQMKAKAWVLKDSDGNVFFELHKKLVLRQKRDFDKGIAHGWSDVRTDNVIFIYHNEKWTFPSIAVRDVMKARKYRMEAKVSDLRKLAKALKIKSEIHSEKYPDNVVNATPGLYGIY